MGRKISRGQTMIRYDANWTRILFKTQSSETASRVSALPLVIHPGERHLYRVRTVWIALRDGVDQKLIPSLAPYMIILRPLLTVFRAPPSSTCSTPGILKLSPLVTRGVSHKVFPWKRIDHEKLSYDMLRGPAEQALPSTFRPC